MIDPSSMYTTTQVMELLNIRSRQTLYNRGWTARAVRAFPGAPDPGPLMWPGSVILELATEVGVEL